MMQVTICYIFQEGERIISLWERKCLVNYLSSLSRDKHTPLKVDVDTAFKESVGNYDKNYFITVLT